MSIIRIRDARFRKRSTKTPNLIHAHAFDHWNAPPSQKPQAWRSKHVYRPHLRSFPTIAIHSKAAWQRTAPTVTTFSANQSTPATALVKHPATSTPNCLLAGSSRYPTPSTSKPVSALIDDSRSFHDWLPIFNFSPRHGLGDSDSASEESLRA